MKLAIRLNITVGDVFQIGIGSERTAAPWSPPPTILLMDPDPDPRTIYGTALKSAGYGVAMAENGEECLRIARLVSPDLVVTELFGPGLDGFGVAAGLRRCPDTREIPVVALTTCAIPSYRLRALREGFAGYLSKPLEPRHLIREVAHWVGPATPGRHTSRLVGTREARR